MHKFWLLWHLKKFSILIMAINSKKHKFFCIFLINNVNLLKILPSNPRIFLFQKFLELFFTPKNTSPKVKNSKLDKRCIFLINKVHLLKILLNNLISFLFPEFLELFFTPKNTPPKVKNSKPDKITIFFGTPCRIWPWNARLGQAMWGRKL